MTADEVGAHRAIHAAVAAGVEIYVAGKAVSTRDEVAYVEEQIRPFLGLVGPLPR